MGGAQQAQRSPFAGIGVGGQGMTNPVGQMVQNTPNNQVPQGASNPLQFIQQITQQPNQALQHQQTSLTQATQPQYSQWHKGQDLASNPALIQQWDQSTGQNVRPGQAGWDGGANQGGFNNNLHNQFENWAVTQNLQPHNWNAK
jgi:hypothetical protein